MKIQNYRNLERSVKGFSNHRRIQMLELIKKEPELSVFEIAEKLRMEIKNVSAHLQKMAIAGLVLKRSDGVNIRHKATNLGEDVLHFLYSLGR